MSCAKLAKNCFSVETLRYCERLCWIFNLSQFSRKKFPVTTHDIVLLMEFGNSICLDEVNLRKMYAEALKSTSRWKHKLDSMWV